MKRTLLSVLALAPCIFSAQAQYFTNGNLAVVRIGGPGESVTTSDNGNPVWIDQYQTNGILVSSFSIPSNGPTALIMDGEPYDGAMTLTPDGTHLVIGGFNTSVPYISNGVPANFAFASSTNVPRAIATLDGYGNYALPIVNSNMFNTFTISGAASDGTNYWATGTGATAGAYGVVYCGTATAPATNEVLTGVYSSGGRGLNIYNGALYALAFPSNTAAFPQAGAFMLNDIIAGELPTNATTATEPLTTGTAAASTPIDLVINPAGTIAYLADYSFGIVKFTNSGSGWVSNYTIYTTNAGYTAATGQRAISVTADFTQTPPVVYATTAELITNRLVMFQDTGPTPNVINLASNLNVSGVGGMTNTFRGVRFVPGSAPLITSQPASVVQTANGSATFTVTSLGSPTLTYQWYTNGTAVAGATTTSLTYNNVTTAENGTVIDVVVANSFGATPSSDAVLTVNPVYFMGGNLAVVSVGGPGQFVSSTDTGNTVSILQFTTGGTEVSTLSLPTTGPGAFTLDGSATEGFMTLTANGQYLVLGGYNAAAGTVTGGPAAATSVNVPRAVVTIDGFGNYAMPISNTNIYSTFNIRGAVFDGTNNFWVSGAGAPANPKGIFYVGTTGSSGANSMSVDVGETGTGNERVLNIFNNTLYVSTGSATHGIWALTGPSSPPPPIGPPTNAPINTIPQPGSASGPYDFAFDSGNTTCYIADGNLGGIIKYTNNAGTWVSNYLIAVGPGTNVGGLAVDYTQNPPVLYATTLLVGAAGNQLISVVDNGAASTVTVLATASATASGSNYFRGVRFVPGEAPMIAGQPAPVIQAAGGDATFTVGVGGTPAFLYQWSTNGVAVIGATDASLTLTDLALSQSGTTVSVVVSNSFGSVTSSNALLTVQTPNSPFDVTITPPTTQTVLAGGTAVFSVSAVGAGITYYWALNGIPLTDGPSISGSSTATLTISPAYATYNGTYTVLASNSFGTLPANNSATLTVTDPVITSQPVGSTNLPNANSTLSVTAVGAPALTYQWLSNGVAVAGATSSTLTVANAGTIVSASYSVIVSNSLGNFVASTATTVSFTPVLLSDTFSYPDGNLFGDAGSPWTDINGSLPEVVTNGRVQISESNATTDARSLFSIPEAGTVIWTSFIINLSTLPSNPGGVYFANLEDTNFGFYGRIFTLTSNNPTYTPNISPVAYPGTYRLGIANAQNDSAPSASSGPGAVVPLDLAPGIDYEVVFYLDLVNGASGMAINPAAVSDVTAGAPSGISSGTALDSFTPALPMAAFGLRQRTDSTPKGEGEGVMEMDNLLISFDWNSTAGSGYSVVTQGITATNPVIGLQPVGTLPGTSNFTGTPFVMEVAASGIGAPGVGLTYAWYQNGTPISDGYSVAGSATPTLTLNPLMATNGGTYYCIVKGAVGGPVQSSNAVLSVSTAITAPFFTLEPVAETTNSQGGTVTFTTEVSGTGPISYQWYFSNSFGLEAEGTDTNFLTLPSLNTNDSGAYYVIATGGTGLQTYSSNAYLTVTGPKSVTIGYLRSLLNPVSLDPSDTTTFFNITGVITTATNLTSGNTASYYLQDSTGGLNLFVSFASDFRPALGDEVTATGTLEGYFGNLELDVNEGSSGYTNYVSGTNFPQPTPILLPWTNNTAPLSPFITANVEGSVIMLTNLYFEAYAPGAVFTAGTDYTVTNNTGITFQVYVSAYDTGLVTGKPIPAFATSIAGPLWQNDPTGPVGIEFTVYSNLVVPVSVVIPPLTNVGSLSAAIAGAGGTNNITLMWTAVPSNYTYSVWYSTNLLQSFTNLVSGLVFSNTVGTYIDSNQTSATKFYEISSP